MNKELIEFYKLAEKYGFLKPECSCKDCNCK